MVPPRIEFETLLNMLFTVGNKKEEDDDEGPVYCNAWALEQKSWTSPLGSIELW